MLSVLSRFKAKRVTAVGAVALIAVAGFAGYAFANMVPVKDVQSIAGNRVVVPSAEMDIVRATWSIDPDKSLVTDVDLLIFPNASVWQLKLFQFFVQVSCLDETVTPPREFICSTGSTRAVLPSHWIGLRPLRIDLKTPINPETTEIHDLSFIVTDLNQVPQTSPALFVGAMPAQIQLAQGETKTIDVVVHGVRGVPAGTQVGLKIEGLPQGVSASFFDVFVTLQPFGSMSIPHAVGKLTLTADAKAPIGETDATITASAAGFPDDSSLAIIAVLLPAVQ